MPDALNKTRLTAVYDGAASRYDRYHAVMTLGADQRGRALAVSWAVRRGDRVLDAGGGTGSAGLLAATAAGPDGHVTVLDLSTEMLAEGRKRATRAGLDARLDFRSGDLDALPFDEGSFDAVISTYSLCPVGDPGAAALALYRVLRPGGRFAFAHSTVPTGRVVRAIAERVERILWHFPSVSLGCRPVEILPALTGAGARVLHQTTLGMPLWPFFVAAVEKPA